MTDLRYVDDVTEIFVTGPLDARSVCASFFFLDVLNNESLFSPPGSLPPPAVRSRESAKRNGIVQNFPLDAHN